MIAAGQPAPDFTATTTDGSTIRLSDFQGSKNVVLYFYPKDNTPGCTKEACTFRDAKDKLAAEDTVILGVSLDDQASHRGFTKKFDLNFPLVVDQDGKICRLYGTLNAERGHSNRITYLIGKDGKILKVYPKVNPEENAQEILDFLHAQG